jgi:hypothetical protein
MPMNCSASQFQDQDLLLQIFNVHVIRYMGSASIRKRLFMPYEYVAHQLAHSFYEFTAKTPTSALPKKPQDQLALADLIVA